MNDIASSILIYANSVFIIFLLIKCKSGPNTQVKTVPPLTSAHSTALCVVAPLREIKSPTQKPQTQTTLS